MSPLASPLFAELRGLPPVLMLVGDAEVFRDDSIGFAERAREAGVTVILEVWPDMFHGFPLCAPILREGAEALRRLGDFVRRH